MTGKMTGKTRDDGAAPPALEGAGEVAATRPPARRMAVRADRTARGRRGAECKGRARAGAAAAACRRAPAGAPAAVVGLEGS